MEEVNRTNFEKLKKGKSIIDFWAPWCGPCKMMGPIFEEVSKEVKGYSFAKCNVDDNTEIAETEDVMSIPTLVIYEKGQEVARTSGAMNAEQFKEWIENANS